MPYVEGKWGRIGLELGEAQGRYQREKAYQAEKARAMAEAQQQLEAGSQADQMRISDLEGEAAAQAPGALPAGQEGPFSVEEQRVHERFARIRKVAENMAPEHRERWIGEEQQRLKTAALTRARKKVAEGIQDRYQRGGFNLLDETEPNPAIDARVEQLMQGLDSDQIDPLKAAEVEAGILETVRKENERRLARKRGTAMIEQQLQKAVDSGNTDLAGRLETLHAMWGTGELEADDLVDKMFEAQYGRKTARASAPDAFAVRKEAMRLWEVYNPGTPPTEEGLKQYIDMLRPPEARPSTKAELEGALRDVGTAYKGVAKAQGDLAGGARGAGVPRETSPSQTFTPRPQKTERQEQAEAKAKRGKAPNSGRADAVGGRPPRPWAKLMPKERKQAETDLVAVATKGGDLRAALKGIGITDPDSLPDALKQKLLALVKKAGGPTMGESLARLRPGAGGM